MNKNKHSLSSLVACLTSIWLLGFSLFGSNVINYTLGDFKENFLHFHVQIGRVCQLMTNSEFLLE